jgi:hypothetical protein
VRKTHPTGKEDAAGAQAGSLCHHEFPGASPLLDRGGLFFGRQEGAIISLIEGDQDVMFIRRERADINFALIEVRKSLPIRAHWRVRLKLRADT